MENQRIPAKSEHEIIPKNGYILVAMPVIAKKFDSGLHKTEKQIQEEANKLPKYVKVVGVAEDTYDLQLGDFVMIARDSPIEKTVISDLPYGLVPAACVIAVATGAIAKDASEKYEKFKIEFLAEKAKHNQSNASNLILGASKN